MDVNVINGVLSVKIEFLISAIVRCRWFYHIISLFLVRIIKNAR